LTLQKPHPKSKAVKKASFYAEWRTRHAPGSLLREEQGTWKDELVPSEKLLQAVWLHQRLLREKLTTIDGLAVEVLHPGFWNREPGPDFRGAVLRMAGEVVSAADIEIDVHSSGWKSHGHDTNPAFKGVALHVVWEGDSRSQLPTLVMKNFLDAPLAELSLWIGRDGAEPPSLAGQCCAPLKELNDSQLSDLLNQAAFVRFQSKAKQFQARAREAGWDQALWEGLFRALGYKHNIWPMQRLAELRSMLLQEAAGGLHIQARLLGVGGLLPDELSNVHRSSGVYVRQLWDHWWRERNTWFDHALPKSLWRFSALRPANHPQRRLALASHWLAKKSLSNDLEIWCAKKIPDKDLASSLHKILQADDEFWSWHWTLRSGRLKAAQPLLGPPRLTDLAANVILPWLWTRAAEGKNLGVQEQIERRFFAWPAGEDNVVLKLARKRLLDSAARKLPRKAAMQQGLLQVVRDFCEQSNALCHNCRFPELVRAWPK
jgi:hypothetical protein